MSEGIPAARVDAELALLREGLGERLSGDARLVDALADAAAAAGRSPVEFLVAEGALSRDVARTLDAIRKGYLRADLAPLLADVELPASLVPAPAPVAEVEAEGGVLGPIPEWGSLAEPPSGSPRPRPRPAAAERRPPAAPTRPRFDPAALRDAPAPGARVDTYTLREVLGVTSTAVVYRAYDELERRSVVIKRLRTLVHSRERERFLGEARILGRLSHPNIIRLVGSGDDGGAPYIVLENIFAIGLDEHLARAGREEPEFILKVAIAASRGLGAAARAGVIHRDVKPANLLLYAGDGRVKVADFGIASDDETRRPDGTGTLRGTPSYMAPELVVSARDVDHRADMYSLGVTLYEAATGRLPFHKSTVLETMRAHVYDAPPAIEALRPGFPRRLAALIERLLSKRPEARFATWSEALATLEATQRQLDTPIADAVTRAVQGDGGGATLTTVYRKSST